MHKGFFLLREVTRDFFFIILKITPFSFVRSINHKKKIIHKINIYIFKWLGCEIDGISYEFLC